MASLLDRVCDGLVFFRWAGSLRSRSDRVLSDKTPSMSRGHLSPAVRPAGGTHEAGNQDADVLSEDSLALCDDLNL
jgi:hypothetical protein